MKKGFTLIEMIGVMVIISLLLMFVMPNVINYVKKGGDIKDKATKELIYKATEKYMDDNKNDFKKDKESTYCVKVSTLATKGYIDGPITLSSSDEDITKETSQKSVKITYDKNYKYDLVSDCVEKINPTPILYKGLTPIEYDEENEKWIVADKTKSDWYNYDEQKWANAVTLLPGVTKEVGDEVKVDGTEASMMLVWIPRYEYKIQGDYGKGGTSTTNPGEIEVNFILRTTKTPSSNDYKVHPAFTFGDQELSGIWVGKFELSHTTLSSSTATHNLGCTNGENSVICTVDSTKFRILPNTKSLRYNNVSNFWYGIKKIEDTSSFGLKNIDMHMIKSSEWGAVAYLSQSEYGKYGNSDYEGTQREVYINNSVGYYTGRSGGNIGGNTSINETYTDQTSVDQYNTYGFYTYDGYLLDYNTNNKTITRDINKGAGASTTGNIYGIYDMSGGAWEYVMGAYGTEADGVYSGYSIASSSDFNGKTGNDHKEVTSGLALPYSKYYDMYTTDNSATACNGGICYGHALSETKEWYGDRKVMASAYYPWLVRGGDYAAGTSSGIFGIDMYSGRSLGSTSTRVVLISK